MHILFQHTAARRRLAELNVTCELIGDVSTHSRPKAAGILMMPWTLSPKSFNTQPPEGGWGWAKHYQLAAGVSTHSRPKAAGSALKRSRRSFSGFNTQPPEGGWIIQVTTPFAKGVSTHSRPKAAGSVAFGFWGLVTGFQHTAARRRLEPLSKALLHQVSQPRFR